MKKLLFALLIGMFLLSFTSALSPVISEEEYVGLQSKSILEDDCKMKIDGKIGKEKIVYYQYDFECILLRGIKQTRELQTKVNELELRIVQLEKSISDLEKIIYETKGTTIITDTKGEVKMWWEFWK